MIEDFRFIRISNGWVVAVYTKGIQKENVYDVFLKDKNDIKKWIDENINTENLC